MMPTLNTIMKLERRISEKGPRCQYYTHFSLVLTLYQCVYAQSTPYPFLSNQANQTTNKINNHIPTWNYLGLWQYVL